MSKKILLADDEPAIITVLSSRLAANNYRVITATTGQECLQKAAEQKPDIIILDIMMPNLDGVATTLKLKSNDNTRHIPIIICTAVKDGHDEIVARSLGVDGYCQKAMGANTLIAEIKRILHE